MKQQNQECPVIVAAAHAAPEHDILQELVRAAVAQQFAGKVDDLEKILAIFDHSRYGLLSAFGPGPSAEPALLEV
ncbi:MAG: hypothetical protein Q7V01_11800 [Vicinamibacterales bacterium]|nr:hypothetical protein [Vicinamibacterales bacterium]